MALITVQLSPDAPITQMDDSELVKTTGTIDNDVEYTVWVEYRLKSDPNSQWAVHRSVDMFLKKAAVFADTAVGGVG